MQIIRSFVHLIYWRHAPGWENMMRLRWLVFALLLLFLTAASVAHAPALTAQSPPSSGLEVVQAAYDDLLDLFFAPPDPVSLLATGWDALSQANGRANRPLPPPLPSLPADRYAALSVFDGAYTSYVATLPAGLTPTTVAFTIVAGMARGLHDQHTTPILPEQLQTAPDGSGRAIGLGLVFAPREPLMVARVAPDGPAEHAGVRPGDVVTAINGVPIAQLSAQQFAQAYLSGAAGSTTTLTVERPNDRLAIAITRGAFYFPVLESRVLADGVGYLSLTAFPTTTSQLPDDSAFLAELDQRLDALDARGVYALILDLRGNPGGLTQTASALLGRFLPPETPTITLSDERGHRATQIVSGVMRPRQLPMAVLVNEQSFSSAELTAATLRETHRAILIGQHTKGALNTARVAPLPGNAALEVAFASVVTATGQTKIDGVGVPVDVSAVDSRDAADYRSGRDPQLNVAIGALAQAPPPPLVRVTPSAVDPATLGEALSRYFPAEADLTDSDRVHQVARALPERTTDPDTVIGSGARDPQALLHTIRQRGWLGRVGQRYRGSTFGGGGLAVSELIVTIDLYASSAGAAQALSSNDFPDFQTTTASPAALGDQSVAYRGTWSLQGTQALAWRHGAGTNIAFLRAVLRHPDFAAGRIDTRFVDEHVAELVSNAAALEDQRVPENTAARSGPGAQIDAVDPLAVLAYGKSSAPARAGAGSGGQDDAPDDGSLALRAPMQATVVSVDVQVGDDVHAGQQVLVLNAMKMEHVIRAEQGGVVRRVDVVEGETVYEGTALLLLDPDEGATTGVSESAAVDLDEIRLDLAEVERRRAITLDGARKAAVERRRAAGGRSARENVADLCDPDSFVEYGQLVVAQGGRGSVEEQLAYSPGDGFVMGLGRVNSDLFEPAAARCLIGAYDYTVIAGTQSGANHRKTDRLFQTAEKLRVPLVLFAGGGGGRSGGRGSSGSAAESGEISGGGGFGIPSWALLGKLSGLVPTVGITAGFCFAGNAALLGCCDLIIATADSNIGMGGPAVIEGGGLGVFRPEEIGPVSVQAPNGVVDITVRDEAAAVQVAKRYLAYFQGPLPDWQCVDQRRLRTAIPENRLRVYDVRAVIETLADAGTVLELRREFGRAMVTALVRIEGRTVGVVANNPTHLSGAIDSDAADKAARFMQLCDAYDFPILFLCDTPGIMVGPEVEKTALVRHAARMWVVGSSIAVPTFTIILRKAYGLGAHTMGGGNHKMPVFTVSWPTGEFGGMGLEAAVKLGRRHELEAITDPFARRDRYEELVAQAYARGSALNAAHVFEVEDVIDPADSRRWLVAGIEASPRPTPRAGKKRSCVDVW